mmetsp:Transcript_107355/g.342218  ORF Transcript_107355/g.342218 Transcript_107355/m.342218 type:complete len:108 (+) Transcript_107355:1501-1824(+)
MLGLASRIASQLSLLFCVVGHHEVANELCSEEDGCDTEAVSDPEARPIAITADTGRLRLLELIMCRRQSRKIRGEVLKPRNPCHKRAVGSKYTWRPPASKLQQVTDP